MFCHLIKCLGVLSTKKELKTKKQESKNKLTIHLDEVPIDQAINLVIRAAGLSYEIVGNSILVANQSKINEDVGVSPAVIPLQYANAEEVALLLEDITEKISIDATGNKLLVAKASGFSGSSGDYYNCALFFFLTLYFNFFFFLTYRFLYIGSFT